MQKLTSPNKTKGKAYKGDGSMSVTGPYVGFVVGREKSVSEELEGLSGSAQMHSEEW